MVSCDAPSKAGRTKSIMVGWNRSVTLHLLLEKPQICTTANQMKGHVVLKFLDQAGIGLESLSLHGFRISYFYFKYTIIL